jgi:hypothetical protein
VLARVLEQDEAFEVRSGAIDALARLALRSPEALPFLERAPGHRDTQIRQTAARALGEAGPDAARALGALARAVDDRDGSVRAAAATAIGRVGSTTLEATEALVRALERVEDWGAPRAAAEAIQRLGPEAHAGVPALVRCLASRHPWHREICSHGLAGIGSHVPGSAEETVPALVATLGDPDVALVLEVLKALGQIGPRAVSSMPAAAAGTARS